MTRWLPHALILLVVLAAVSPPARAATQASTLATGDRLTVTCPDTLALTVTSANQLDLACGTPVAATAVPVATATAAPTATGTPSSVGKLGWSSAYLAGWLQPNDLSSLPWTGITHLISFTMQNNRDGTLDDGAGTSLTPARRTAAVQAAHSHGKKALLAIGGIDDQNWDAACSPAIRPTWVNNVVAAMQQSGYDGIDLDVEQDWQYPDHTDFIACVRDLRARFDTMTPRPLLTEPGDPDWQAPMLSQVWQYLDQVNLMDYWRDAAGNQAGLDRYVAAGIPKRLLGVGIGLDDGGYDGTHTADCAAKAKLAVDGGYGGVMEFTVTGPGAAACFGGIAPYVGG